MKTKLKAKEINYQVNQEMTKIDFDINKLKTDFISKSEQFHKIAPDKNVVEFMINMIKNKLPANLRKEVNQVQLNYLSVNLVSGNELFKMMNKNMNSFKQNAIMKLTGFGTKQMYLINFDRISQKNDIELYSIQDFFDDVFSK